MGRGWVSYQPTKTYNTLLWCQCGVSVKICLIYNSISCQRGKPKYQNVNRSAASSGIQWRSVTVDGPVVSYYAPLQELFLKTAPCMCVCKEASWSNHVMPPLQYLFLSARQTFKLHRWPAKTRRRKKFCDTFQFLMFQTRVLMSLDVAELHWQDVSAVDTYLTSQLLTFLDRWLLNSLKKIWKHLCVRNIPPYV